MRILRLASLLLLVSLPALAAPTVTVERGAATGAEPLDGRLILVVSPYDRGEPRFHVSWGLGTAQIFGLDVEAWKPGESATFDALAIGHPLASLDDLEPGDYFLQAVLHRYETFERADGHVVKLPADDGEGQQWARSPGNLYSEPLAVTIADDSAIALTLTGTIPPIDPPVDTEYVRHLRMRSELLTEFWGKPTYISAIVLVPEGFDEHPDERYPVLYNQGHFPASMRFFRETPPDDDLQGWRRASAQRAHDFYRAWTSGELPRVVIVLTQHATPYYDDSYGVNTANHGPYGDALTQEFYPRLERTYRGIGAGWSRVVYGGSTGGWMSLAQQVFYPEFFGGVWSYCPDPVDFHAFQLIDVYEDTNAYYAEGPFKKLERPLGRGGNGMPFTTVADFDRQEEVLGTRGRSGGQLDAFHATFGPVADDGYPAELWEPGTGRIDPEVARHWRENYDLTAYLKRRWAEIGPSLVGKIHVTMGTKDTFYLETASEMLETFLESTEEPYYGGSFDFGDNEPHCYTGIPEDAAHPTVWQVRTFAEHVRASAPPGADTSWFTPRRPPVP